MLRVQANLPDTAPGQNVTMLLFGDVQLENAVTNPTTTLDATAANAISVRQKPVNGSAVVGKPFGPCAWASTVNASRMRVKIFSRSLI